MIRLIRCSLYLLLILCCIAFSRGANSVESKTSQELNYEDLLKEIVSIRSFNKATHFMMRHFESRINFQEGPELSMKIIVSRLDSD